MDNFGTFKRGDLLYQGKANNVYATSDPRYLELEASDRISAGNGAKKDVISGKGRANNLISSAIFMKLEEIGIPTHYVGPGSNECSKVVKKVEPIKLEVIGRFFAAGSFVERYDVPAMTLLDPVYIEYTYKNDASGDPPICEDAIVTKGLLTRRELGYVEYMTERIAYALRDFFAECGGNLIDFKVEFGKLENGQIILADEVSPDTFRFRDQKSGKSLDKDRFRQDMGRVAEAYAEMANRVAKYGIEK